MPLAVTHVISTVVLVDLYRDYITRHKHYFSLGTVFLAGLAGLLPDIDIPLGWVLKLFGLSLQHGGYTHTLAFRLLFLIPGLVLWQRKKHKPAVAFFVVSFGIFLHILLDYALGGGAYEGVMWLWPISTQAFKLHLLRRLSINNIPNALDAIILLAWLYHEEAAHKIRDYI